MDNANKTKNFYFIVINMKKISGIYKITNKLNNKCYIGEKCRYLSTIRKA